MSAETASLGLQEIRPDRAKGPLRAEEEEMKPGLLAGLTLFSVLCLGHGPAPASEPTHAPLRAVRRPCSLTKVCAELSRRSGGKVFVDPGLADLRVVWSYNSAVPLETTLARLAELTGGRIEVFPS